METILAMHVAAQLTQAACQGGNLPISADLSDNTVRAKNLQVWETFRVFYRGVVAALADPTSWPPAKIDAGNLFAGLPGGLAGILNNPAVAEILKKLIAAIPLPNQLPAGPLPDPGQKK